MHVCMPAFSVMSSSVTPWTISCQAPLCPWDSPGKNTGVGCHVLLQRIFPDSGVDPMSPVWQEDSLTLSHLGSRRVITGGLKVYYSLSQGFRANANSR